MGSSLTMFRVRAMQIQSQDHVPQPIAPKKSAVRPALTFDAYETDGFYDEMIDEQGRPRPVSELLIQKI